MHREQRHSSHRSWGNEIGAYSSSSLLASSTISSGTPSPLMTSRALSVPPEIIVTIIDILWSLDRSSICQCSLVHKTWLPRTRHHLFRDLRITAKSLRSLIRLIESNHHPPTFLSFPRELIIFLPSAPRYRTHEWLESENLGLISACLNEVNSIQIISSSIEKFAQPFCMDLISSGIRSENLKHLTLRNIDFPRNQVDSGQIVYAISGFPHLQTLSLQKMNAFVPREADDLGLLPSITLESLSLVDVDPRYLSLLANKCDLTTQSLHMEGSFIDRSTVSRHPIRNMIVNSIYFLCIWRAVCRGLQSEHG